MYRLYMVLCELDKVSLAPHFCPYFFLIFFKKFYYVNYNSYPLEIMLTIYSVFMHNLRAFAI